ncbi:MAG: glycosylphosphatidylinositol anchor biosynthesis, partial [Thelocarpon superellum]
MGAQSRRNDVPSESEGATPKSVQHTGRATTEGIFLFLLAFRLLNALSTKTFFQPDEYFQSLEPAWAWAFGSTSGAWITWEWEHQLRSAIHPAIFAATYYSASGLATLFALNAATRANILIAAPKIVQAACAATGDFYTW